MKGKKLTAVLLTGSLMAQTMLLGACSASKTENTGDAVVQAEETTAQAEETAAQTEETTVSAEETPVRMAGTAKDRASCYADGANGFAFRFTKEQLTEMEEGENLITSPYSVWLPLAALANATDEAAKEQLLSALGESGMDPAALNEMVKNVLAALRQEERSIRMKENGEEFESPLQIANALFVNENEQVKQEFADLFAENYGGKLFSVDFKEKSAVDAINAWASEQTHGKIENIVDSFDPRTVAAIANAIYFSDNWANQFNENDTVNDIFHGAKGDEAAAFMNQKFKDNPYYEDADMQVMLLPTMFGGRMLVMLPKEGKTAEELLAAMDGKKLETILDTDSNTVQFAMPKFKIESDVFSVKEAMEAIGIPLTDSMNPHLNGLVEGEPLYISQAVQKAMIEVDEKGMTAAAVTIMAMERMALIPEREPVIMKCDRPFAFILTARGSDAGEQVLFTGIVNRIAAK